MNIWHQLVQLSRKTRVQIRLIVSILLLTMIPLSITGIITYNKSNQAISSKTSTFTTDILQLQANKIRTEVKKYETFADQIMLNVDIQNAFLTYDTMSDLARGELYKHIEDTVLQDNFWVYAMIKSLQIQTKDGGSLYDSGFVDLKNEDILRLREIGKRNGKIDSWTYASTTGEEPTIVLVRRIPSIDGQGEPLGYLIVAIDEELFSKLIFSDVNMGKGSDQIILNGSREILASKNHNFQKDQIKNQDDPLGKWLDNKRNSENVITKEGRFFAVYTHNEELDWNLIGLIPLAYLNTESKDIQNEIILVVFVCLLFAIFFTMLISTSISSPLKKLVSGMNQVMSGNLNITIHDDGKDEIGYISEKFKNMVTEIRLLIESVQTEQTKKREAELQMLQAQINPHFLFNTLNSLKWTAMLSQADSVSDGISALAELLRSTIVHKDERITLRDELRNIANYIIIQQIRYGTSLQVVQVIEEELLNAQVLKFLLQPIVENAIIHGLEGLDRDPKITISAEHTGHHLKITLSDNGKGISEEKLQQLFKSGTNPSKKRFANIGIGNVSERIKLHYGDAYGLEIFSELDQGTTIVITIPYVQTTGGE